MNTPTEKPSLGQIASEAYHPGYDWDFSTPRGRQCWEAAAQAVRAAVLAELPQEGVNQRLLEAVETAVNLLASERESITAKDAYHILSPAYQAAKSAPAQPTPQPLAQLVDAARDQTNLVDRLCSALERSEQDIGGESARSVLLLLGPANEKAREAIPAAEKQLAGQPTVEPVVYSQAWSSVCDVLDEIAPNWRGGGDLAGATSAVAAIRKLAQERNDLKAKLAAKPQAEAKYFVTAERAPTEADGNSEGRVHGWDGSDWELIHVDQNWDIERKRWPFWKPQPQPPAPEPVKPAWEVAWDGYREPSNGLPPLRPDVVSPVKQGFLAGARWAAKANHATLASLPEN